MSNLSIQNVQNVKANDVSFQGKKNYEADNKVSEDKGIKTSTKLMLGATALAATVAAVILTKGKVKAPVKPEVNPNTIADNLPENLSHLDINLFKKFGKFEKGKATFNGKPYSGTIHTENAELLYNNGIIERSTSGTITRYYDQAGNLTERINRGTPSIGGRGERWFRTTVERLEDGTKVIKKYEHPSLSRNKDHHIITTIKPDGSITRLTTNKESIYTELNNQYTYDKLENLNTGEVTLIKKGSKINEFANIPKNARRKVVIDGKKVTQELDTKGNVVRSWTTEYNPKTGISTRNIDNGSKIIMRDKKGNILETNGVSYSLKIGSRSFNGRYYDTLRKADAQELIQKFGLPFKI